MALSTMSGLTGQPIRWEGITCLPSGYTTYGNDVIGHHARSFFGGGRGLLLVIYDAWCIDAEAIAGLATAVWSPVHSDKVSGGDRLFYALSGAQPIAMSRFGETQMRDVDLQPVYVPHGVDTAAYRPLDPADREAAREFLRVDRDAFLIAVVAANKGTNPPRKGWGEQLQAFARFRARHDDAVLFIHTLANSPHGIDLRPIVADLGLEKAVRFSADYPQVTGLYGPGYLQGLMGAADVLSNASYGEGFGLPVLEAQACGTPVVVADNSAQPELCASGWLADCQPYWSPEDMAWWHVPLIGSVVKQWEKAYRARGDEKPRRIARHFAEQYDADLVFTQYWKPALEMLEQYAGAVPVRLPDPGAVPLRTREDDGLRWIIRGHHTGDGLAIGHEDGLKPVFDRMLPGGGVFLDVGAHVGRWSLRMAKKASRVIAVEANPETAAVLRAHLALNDVTNVDVLELAAWDTETRLNLDDPNHQASGGSTRVVETAGEGLTRAAPLDTVLAGEPRIDLIKLDVEGADLRALNGMAGTLARCRPKLLIERHDIYGYYELDDLTALLESLGYRWEHVTITLQGGATAPYIAAEPEGE